MDTDDIQAYPKVFIHIELLGIHTGNYHDRNLVSSRFLAKITQKLNGSNNPRTITSPIAQLQINSSDGGFDPSAIAFEHRTGERRSGAGQKGRAAGELHRRTGTAMQHTDRVKRGVRGVHARERQPVVAGDLPGNGLQGVVCHGNGLCVILPYVYAN